jgi:hypothetical protein
LPAVLLSGKSAKTLTSGGGAAQLAIDVSGLSIARIAPLFAVVSLLGVGLLMFSAGASNVTAPFAATGSAVTTWQASTATGAQSSGSVTFWSPAADSEYTRGQNCTITGTVAGMKSPQDDVTIQVNQQGSMLSLVTEDVIVRPGGGFSFSILIGESWPIGTYVIRATDTNGATGSATFMVTNGDPWID